MDLRDIIKTKSNRSYDIIENLVNDSLKIDLIDLFEDLLEEEDYEDGIVSRFIPRVIFNVLQESSAADFLKSLNDVDFTNDILKKFNISLLKSQKVTTSMTFEIFQGNSKSPLKSNLGSYKESVTLKLFFGNSNYSILVDNNNLDLSDGNLICFEDKYGIPTQVKNNSKEKLYVLTLSIKTELVNPAIIHNRNDKDQVGVIINCKDTESPSVYKGLEYGLANLTRYTLAKNNFSNIIAFSNHIDFDKAVETLKSNNIKKIILLFSGSMVGAETYNKVLESDHITAWKENDTILRRYVVFETEKYEYFQIKGNFLSNVKDKIISKIPEELEITSLQPDEKTYEFLEQVYDGIIPDIKLLDQENEGDLYQGNLIIEQMKEIMLNTV